MRLSGKKKSKDKGQGEDKKRGKIPTLKNWKWGNNVKPKSK